MKSVVAILLFSMLLIIVYFIKKQVVAVDKDINNDDFEKDQILQDKIEPLEIALIEEKLKKEELVLQFKEMYSKLTISEIYLDLEQRYQNGQMDKESYQIQLEKILDQIDLKMTDLDLN